MRRMLTRARGTRYEPRSTTLRSLSLSHRPFCGCRTSTPTSYHFTYPTHPTQASLRLFNPREFNQLLSGAAADGPGGGGAAALDVADMRRWARYSGGYRCVPQGADWGYRCVCGTEGTSWGTVAAPR